MRLCIVDGTHKGWFHRWEDIAEVIEPGIAIGSHPGGQYYRVVGIVEYEDGSIHEIKPSYIRFLDTKELP